MTQEVRAVNVEPVLTTKEVAAALRVDRNTVIRWLNEGAIRGFQLPGGDWRISRSELERIMTPQTEEVKQA